MPTAPRPPPGALQVIKGNSSAKFTVTYTSDRPLDHASYLIGSQRVFSPAAPLQLHAWPTGPAGDGVGVLLSGTFHPYAGAPPTPLQPLRVDLAASTVASRLEPDANAELSWTVHSTMQQHGESAGAPPGRAGGVHPSFMHTVTLSNTQSCPQIFCLDTRGPFDLVAAVPSVPQVG